MCIHTYSYSFSSLLRDNVSVSLNPLSFLSLDIPLICSKFETCNKRRMITTELWSRDEGGTSE